MIAPSGTSSAIESQRQSEFDHALLEDAMRVGGPVTLLGGRTIRVRAIRPDDGGRLCAFHARLSPETIHLRYFGTMPILSEEQALRLACVDYERRMAVIASPGFADDEPIIALVGYELIVPLTAEVAFVVEDAWQGLGIATQLLYALAAYARCHGIVTFVANVMPRNERMLGLLRNCGFPYAEYEHSVVEVRLEIAAPPASGRLVGHS